MRNNILGKKKMTDILIGIPTVFGTNKVDILLQSIKKRELDFLSNYNVEIAICDDSGNNGNNEKTKSLTNEWQDQLADHYIPIKLLTNETNVGIATSWNKLVQSSNSKYVILLNDDIVVAKGSIKTLIYFLENNDIGAAGFELIDIKEEEMVKALNIEFLDNSPYRSVTSPTWGAFFGFSRYKYDLTGGFDQNYFAYCEETDFVTSLAQKGYPSYMLKCPKSWHVHSATLKKNPNWGNILNQSIEYFKSKWGEEQWKNFYVPTKILRYICDNNVYEYEDRCEKTFC